MIRLYVISMFLIPLVDAFDRAWERYGHHCEPYEAIPDKVFCFGTLKGCRVNGVMRDLRYARLKLPTTTWGQLYPFAAFPPGIYGWRTHYLQWIEGAPPPHGPLTIYPPFGD